MAHIRTAELEPQAGLTTVGDLNFGGNAVIDGRDTDPPQWPGVCDTPNEDKPGLLVSDTTLIDYQGNRTAIENNQLFGTPDVAQDTSITPASLTVFGDMTWDELTELADKRYNFAPSGPAPVSVGGVCDTSSQFNWGHPLSNTDPCFNFFPIILLNNPGQGWQLSGGIGQGILLVEGDLRVTGTFAFYGPIFIKGTLQTAGGGGVKHFHGGVVSANADLDQNSVLGTADIVYSSCAIQRALLGNRKLAKARPLVERSWVDLSSVIY